MQWKPRRSAVLAAVTAVGFLVMSVVAQRVAQSAPDTNTAEMLAQNFKAEHEIGKQYRIDPAKLRNYVAAATSQGWPAAASQHTPISILSV